MPDVPAGTAPISGSGSAAPTKRPRRGAWSNAGSPMRTCPETGSTTEKSRPSRDGCASQRESATTRNGPVNPAGTCTVNVVGRRRRTGTKKIPTTAATRANSASRPHKRRPRLRRSSSGGSFQGCDDILQSIPPVLGGVNRDRSPWCLLSSPLRGVRARGFVICTLTLICCGGDHRTHPAPCAD